jgi:hypothetical protein
MNLYQKIRETAKGYVLPVILTGSLALGSCNSSHIPVSSDAKKINMYAKKEMYDTKINEMDSLINIANSHVMESRKILDDGIKAKNIDSSMLENMLKNYKQASQKYSEVNDSASKFFTYSFFSKNTAGWKYAHVKLSPEDSKLKRRCNKVLHFIDIGKAELQKDLEKQGLEVKVYNPSKPEEDFGWIFYGALMLTAAIGSACAPISNETKKSK